jgi:hypothetical protein
MRNFTNSELQENARYILKILNSQKTVLWSWGVSAFYSLEHKEKKALRFTVNGLLHKGYVYVMYNEGQDLFEILITDKKGNEKKFIEGVYFDDLSYTIDELVETGKMTDDQYKQKVNSETYKF